MPRILRHAWQARLREDGDFAAWREDFARVTGYEVFWLEEVDQSEGLQPGGRVCAGVQARAEGCRMCLRFRLGLAERARQEGAAWGVCDAGLREGVVTLVRGGVEVGFLLIGGCRGADTAGRQRRRTEHLLSRLGEAGRFGEHGALFSAAREVPEEYFSATLRLLASAQAAGRDRRTGKAGTAGTAVRPAAVQKALGLIRARALTEEIRLGEVAEECGVSAEHLSRLFRRHAGVGFQEYVARFRVESVCDRLVHDARSVTEIALGCGFSSLAQFYRAFAKFTGTTPQAYRRGRAP